MLQTLVSLFSRLKRNKEDGKSTYMYDRGTSDKEKRKDRRERRQQVTQTEE